MNTKIKNISYKPLYLAAFVIACAFCFALPAKAVTTYGGPQELLIYPMVTDVTTPEIRGTINDPSYAINVKIDGGGTEYPAIIGGDGKWAAPITDALDYGFHSVEAIAIKDGSENDNTEDDALNIVESKEFPSTLYLIIDNQGRGTEIIFVTAASIDVDTGFTFSFLDDTSATVTGGHTFSFDNSRWPAEVVDPESDLIIKEVRFGMPGLNLHFSPDMTLAVDVGDTYEGQTLNVFSRPDSQNSSWELLGTCDVSGGICSFDVSHASYFAISGQGSIATDNNDESINARIDSWKAYRYENQAGGSCRTKLKLTIKGRHFDKDAEVRIGGKKASSVNVKSSRKLTAKFCLSKLLDAQTDHKRTISVTNPDAGRKEARKKIDLDNISYLITVDSLDTQSLEGIKNIQTALSQLGFLDQQYITGIYGPITTEAVRTFQEQNGLPTTGFVGPLTLAKLQEKMK